jgi:murein DD-endopeptidase MepM/ murein hydrolase activator NlpD
LAARTAEPAGVIVADETNLRDGPGTDYSRQVQLDRGRQVALRARHDDWLQVEIAGSLGWVRADLLQIADGLVDSLPVTDDFPPPPPRWVWPARGALSSTFGSRWGGFHNGIDIANRAWTTIVAARSGQVSEAGWCSGYGYCVKISHGGGVETIYGHMVAKPSVSAGEQVSAGQLIGYMGSTYDRAGGGYSTGVHLHFTVLINGRAVNPLNILP